MATKESANKMSKSDKRRGENIRTRLRNANVGEDLSTRVAQSELKKKPSGRGGGKNSGAEAKKRTKHGGQGRTGSKSNQQK